MQDAKSFCMPGQQFRHRKEGWREQVGEGDRERETQLVIGPTNRSSVIGPWALVITYAPPPRRLSEGNVKFPY
jgi:hypothetical protein